MFYIMRMGNAHASHCHLWPVRLYIIFPHSLINEKISEEKLLNMKFAFDVIKTVHQSSCYVPGILVRYE